MDGEENIWNYGGARAGEDFIMRSFIILSHDSDFTGGLD
jgi:hypothetical protein